MLFGSICTNQHVAYVKSYACHGASADLRGGTGTRASLSKLIKYMNKITGRTKVKTCPSQKKNLYFASPSFVTEKKPWIRPSTGFCLCQLCLSVRDSSIPSVRGIVCRRTMSSGFPSADDNDADDDDDVSQIIILLTVARVFQVMYFMQ